VAKRYSAFSSSGSRVSVSTIDPPNHTAKPISHVVFLSTIVRHFTHDLAIIPVLNKIDLPSARVDAVGQQIADRLGVEKSSIIACSAKTGLGVPEILRRVITDVPPPKESAPEFVR
jgi:translation elongation factor EF-4